MRNKLFVLLLAGCASIAFRQNVHAAGGGDLFARADSLYAAGEYDVARPMYSAAAAILETANYPDSAALAIYQAGACYLQRRQLETFAAYTRDTLAPSMRRLGTRLALGLEQQALAQIAFRKYELETALVHYRAAYAAFDIAGRLDLKHVMNGRQEIGYSQMALGRIDSAVYYASEAVHLAERYHAPCSREVAYAHFALGGIYYVTEDLTQTAAHYTLAKQAFDEALPVGHPHLIVVLTNLSELQDDMGHLDKALAYAQEALRRSVGTDPHIAYSASRQYAVILGELSLPADSYHWAQLARQDALAAWEPNHVNQAGILIMIAEAALTLGDTVQARNYLDTTATLFGIHPEGTTLLLTSYHTARGELAVLRGDLPEALGQYHLALGAAYRHQDSVDYAVRTALNGLIDIHLSRGAVDSSAYYYTTLSEVLADQMHQTTPWLLDYYVRGAEIDLARREYTSAAMRLRGAYDRIQRQPEPEANRLSLFSLASTATDLWRVSPTPEHRRLLVDLAGASAASLQSEYAILTTEGWIDAFVEDLRKVFTAAAFAAVPDAARATYFADLPRAMRLRRRGAEAVAAQHTQLPDSLRVRGQQLRQRLVALRYSEMDSARRHDELQRVRGSIAEHEATVRNDYPSYYQAVASPLALDPDAAPPTLRQRRVSFLVDEGAGRLLVCALGGAGGAQVHVADFGEEVQRQVRDFKTEVATQSADRLGELGYALYRRLLAPVLPDAAEGSYALVLASDGVLADLPFAALLTSVPPAGASYGDWPWLGRLSTVSYVDALASGQVRSEVPQRHSKVGHLDLACVAPGFAERAQTVALSTGFGTKQAKLGRTPWTAALATLLGERYGATVLAEADATERAFVGAYATHDIVHLGTHAFLDDETPLRSYFALTPTSAERDDDGQLFAYEIYGLAGGARLAVLPACHSGAGEFKGGEGTLSLATAFRNSGCPTVVQSFWSIDDQQTNALLEPFYAHLAGGAPVAEALGEAQREYLATAPEPLQHPYYWAGLAVVGPAVSFGESPQTWPYWLLGALLLLGGTIFYHRRVHLGGVAR